MTEKQGISYTSPNDGFWTIPDVAYKGEIGTYRLFEQMTYAMTQNQLAEFYEREKAKGNPIPTDAPMIQAVVTKAHELRNQNPNESERLRRFLQTGFKRYPSTLTKVIYNPSEKDKIVHNHKTSDEYSIDEHIVGRDCWIRNISNKKVLESLLGTSNIKQIDEVSQWINKTNTYILRLNSKSKTKNERAVRLVAADGFILDCREDPFIEYPAFRVLKVD